MVPIMIKISPYTLPHENVSLSNIIPIRKTNTGANLIIKDMLQFFPFLSL